MSDGDGGADDVDLAGRSREAAVMAVVNADPTINQVAVRSALDPLTEDGVVTREALEEEVAALEEVVSTPENRVEDAAAALDDAREAAGAVDDVDVVRARLDGLASQLSAIEARVDALEDDRRALRERVEEEGVTYGLADEVRRVRDEASDLVGVADDFRADLEAFERWLDRPGVRFDELEADVGALEEAVAGLDAAVEGIEGSADGTDASTDGSEEGADPGARWADAWIDHRVTGLLLADVRSELADLRALSERGDHDAAERAEGVADRLDDVRARHESIGDRLRSTGRPGWRDRFEERLSAVEETLEAYDPPVDWEALQASFEDGPAGSDAGP